MLSQRIIGPANVAYEQEVRQIPEWWISGQIASIPHVLDATFLASTSAAMMWRVGAREIATTRPINVIVACYVKGVEQTPVISCTAK